MSIKNNLKHNKGQVTLFVIIALLIITSITLYFTIAKTRITTTTPITQNPTPFLSSCIEEATQKTIENIMPQGGYEHNKHNITYEKTDIAYLCYTNEYNKKCTNQEPLYKKHLEQEISDNTKKAIETCYETLKEAYEEQGINTNLEENTDIKITIQPGMIQINVKKAFTYEQEETKNINNILTFTNSPLYDLTNTIEEIIHNEASFCTFDQNAYTIFNPEITINKKGLSEGTKIYSLKESKTGLTTNIAIRGCVLQLQT